MTTTAPLLWSFMRGQTAIELGRGTDFVASSGGQPASAELANAELVFAGDAIQAPEYDWDDFEDVDLRGKVLVVLNNDPEFDPALFEGTTRPYYGRWTYKYESVARRRWLMDSCISWLSST